jgi:hypothetical protein
MFEELERIHLIIKQGVFQTPASSPLLGKIDYQGQNFPVYSYIFGNPNPSSPVLFITGGIHGLERIGAELCLSFLKSFVERMTWDQNFIQLLEGIKVIFIPLVNPVGYAYFMRSNGQGVDLMRNSPLEAEAKVPWLLGGHRISNKIPWFQGRKGVLEKENELMCNLFFQECRQSEMIISLDLHSGFGLKDRLWFPYSGSKKIFEQLWAVHALTQLFESSYPYHIYQIEPQSEGYLLSGDIWDYLFFEIRKTHNPVFIPLTLEMGSWNWVKKNPIQLISKHGLFNPIKKHRIDRTFRRHHIFFDFLLRSLFSSQKWLKKDEVFLNKHQNLGINRWYDQ